MSNQYVDFRDKKESLDHVRNTFNKSESILSEESMRDIIRKEIIQNGVTNQEQSNYNENMKYENKKVSFSDKKVKQYNKTRLIKDLHDFDIHESRNKLQNNVGFLFDFEYQQQQMNEDLRNTVLFEEIPNQKQKIKLFNNSLWDEILLFYEKNDLNSCYQIVLDEEDDVYLIKLMMLTGPCLKSLEINNSKRLMSRLCMILDSKFLEKMYLEIFDHSLQERILDNLTPIEQKKLTNEVYKLSSSSNPQVGEQSAELYIRLAQKFSQNY
ncbi:hypothetical protein ABPG72_001202 [Tetrahymena utriculariae]